MTKDEILSRYKETALDSGYKVLEYLLNNVDLNTYTKINKKEVAEKVGLGYATVVRAMLDLQNSKIVFRRMDDYHKSEYMLNPKLRFYGG